MMIRHLPWLAALFLLAACSKPEEKKGAPPALITTTQAQTVVLETIERTLGTLEAVMDPKVAAEVTGRVIAIEVHNGQTVKKGQILARIDPTDIRQQAQADSSDIARLETLLAQQERLLARQTELVGKNFISRNALDEITAQRDALKSQIAAARARGAISRNSLGKTEVTAPFDGQIEVQIASVGDFVRAGEPLFRLISNAVLRANLPFPESAAAHLKPGMVVRLISPLAPDQPLTGKIDDIRPAALAGSRAIEAIVRLDNPGPLIGGASVDAFVVTSSQEGAIVVPEQSVVLRPAGRVVYAIVGGKAEQRPVQVGSKQEGFVEIREGIKAGETIALDGAGFLTHGAAVVVRPPEGKPAAEKPADKPAVP